MSISRREFVGSTLAGSLAAKLKAAWNPEPGTQAQQRTSAAPKAIIVSAANGYNYLDEAYALVSSGGDTLEAALKVVVGPENDPSDQSGGLGGRPNEEGVVELDACCMHGPTRTAGAVGGVRNIKNVS